MRGNGGSPGGLGSVTRIAASSGRWTTSCAACADTATSAMAKSSCSVVRYYDAAEVAWEADEDVREREKRPRHYPSSEGATAPYFADSDAEATIVEFPFLRDTVVREPGTAAIEVSGLWRPIQARALLWEKGREQLDRLAEWVRAGR